MNTINSNADHKHLTFDDRLYIQTALYQRKTYKEIGEHLHKDPSTISKEVKRFIKWNDSWSVRQTVNDCQNQFNCDMDDLCMIMCGRLCKDCTFTRCSWYCPSYVPMECPLTKKPPYVCNGCPASTKCKLRQYYYSAERAQKRYQSVLVDSRKGINMDESTLQAVNDLISPLIRKGQPLSHIFATHKDEIPCSRTTLYNYLDQGLFDVRNIDLPRRVRYKLRKQHRNANPIKYDYRIRRSFEDYTKYTEAFPDYEVVQMDTVKGTKEAGKCLLTLLFCRSNFMLIFVIPSCSQASVKEVFDYLYVQLGSRIFKQTFRLLLTDNGSEFKDPWSLEKDKDGKSRTKVFYCDPYSSNQKGKIEKNHEFIRCIIPQGRSMHNLTQDDAVKMMCHINSVKRDSLKGKCPFDLAELLINKKVLTLLGLHKVSPDEVTLRPTLLKK